LKVGFDAPKQIRNFCLAKHVALKQGREIVTGFYTSNKATYEDKLAEHEPRTASHCHPARTVIARKGHGTPRAAESACLKLDSFEWHRILMLAAAVATRAQDQQQHVAAAT
jgi:hypothetical protein